MFTVLSWVKFNTTGSNCNSGMHKTCNRGQIILQAALYKPPTKSPWQSLSCLSPRKLLERSVSSSLDFPLASFPTFLENSGILLSTRPTLTSECPRKDTMQSNHLECPKCARSCLTKSACAAFWPRSLSHSFLQPALPLPAHLTDNSRASHTLVISCEI